MSRQKKSFAVIALIAGLLVGHSTWAKLNVFACEPEWAALVNELGGKHVKVRVAISPFQDPHRIEARPSLIARLRRADLLVCNGAGLEQGWLPLVLRRASNGKVLPGQPGHFLAANHVTLAGKPVSLDRSHGDIHADGNPHIHTSPENILLVARALSQRLATVDAQNALFYQQRFKTFSQTWSASMKEWRLQAVGLKGKRIVSQHKTWEYLLKWVGVELVTTIEDKPGVTPSLRRLNQVLAISKSRKVKLIVFASHTDPKTARWLSGRSGIKAVELPYTVGSQQQTATLKEYFDTIMQKLGGN